jgi:Uma2 family endonuclease
MHLKIRLQDQIRIINSNKDFILFDYENNKLTGYQLSNNLDYKNKFKTFRVLSCIKKELSNKTINI